MATRKKWQNVPDDLLASASVQDVPDEHLCKHLAAKQHDRNDYGLLTTQQSVKTVLCMQM